MTTAPVTLLMAIHCHQPVGNFDFVFEEAYHKAYEPFLQRLERHPSVRLAMHYSGSLLDWLVANHPEFIRRVKALVKRGQVELLSSGYFEPILPLLPQADRQGQLALMQHALHRHFGERATGLWLTERVWEPDLPTTLTQAGLRYTMLDTNQFQSARRWLPAHAPQAQDEAFWDLFGCYATQDAGGSTVLFPASKRLRYWLPFQPVAHSIEWLRRLQRQEPVAVTFADDGEKFGFWPKTHDWVYEQGWLDQWFAALERESGWLRTSTFRDYLAYHGTNGVVSLPCGSYEEMLEWSGGYFRNFFTKYPEANAMQQKMLRVSRALQEVSCFEFQVSSSGRNTKPETKNQKLLERARHELYAGQCNCAYWHGVFGGLYLSHLRRAVYQHLIEAERLVRHAQPAPLTAERRDADGDGRPEVRVATTHMSLVIDPDEGGALTEWSLFGSRVNLVDTLTRRAEPYHETLRAREARPFGGGQDAVTSIHDALGVKEQDLASRLIYDDHRRSAWLEYGLQRVPTLAETVQSTWGEQRLWSPGAYTARIRPRSSSGSKPIEVILQRALPQGQLRKILRVASRAAAIECSYELEDARTPVLAVEFNVNLRDERYLHAPGQVSEVSAWTIEEPALGVALTLSVDRPATLLHFPIETVSESEEGLERTFQGVAVLCVWTLDGAASPDGVWRTQLTWSADESGNTTRSRAPHGRR